MEKEIILVPVSKKFKEWPIPLLLAGLIFGEARGCQATAKIAVAFTVLNRVEAQTWFGETHHAVMLKKWQYSCFNRGDPNRKKILNPLDYEPLEVWQECYQLAEGILEGKFLDPTTKYGKEGGTHYFDRSLQSPPKWAGQLEFKTQIGPFSFYG